MRSEREQKRAAVMAAVRDLMRVLDDEHSAEKTFKRVIETTGQLPLTHLGNWEQNLRWEIRPLDGGEPPSRWAKIFGKGTRRRPATWLDLCNHSGYAREAALTAQLGGAPNAFFLALALRRLNDWVPEVRAAARERLVPIAEATAAEHVADAVCALLPHWATWRRQMATGRRTLQAVAAITPVAALLKTRILFATTGPMPQILVQLGQTDLLDSHMLEFAEHAVQPAVRARAYRVLLDGKISWLAGYERVWIDKRWGKYRTVPQLDERTLTIEVPFIETLGKAIADRSPMVRRVAGMTLIRERHAVGDELRTFATILAADGNPSVAENGQYLLDKLEAEA